MYINTSASILAREEANRYYKEYSLNWLIRYKAAYIKYDSRDLIEYIKLLDEKINKTPEMY